MLYRPSKELCTDRIDRESTGFQTASKARARVSPRPDGAQGLRTATFVDAVA
jgi:hypothetical protein